MPKTYTPGGAKIDGADWNELVAMITSLTAEVSTLKGGVPVVPVTPPSVPVTGTSPSAMKWWIEYGGDPHVRLTYETTTLANGTPQVAWVTSTADARVPTSLLEVDVPVLAQAAWEAYLEDTTNPGVRLAESGVVTGAADRWNPTAVALVGGRTYRGWARARTGTSQWSPWASTRFVAPTGKVLYFEDFGAVGDGVNVDGADYQASPAITRGPIRQAMAACAPGDVVKSKKPGVTVRGVAASGTTLTAPAAGAFPSSLVGKKVMVYGAGVYEGRATYAAASGSTAASVTVDTAANAVHRTTITAVSSDGKTATLALAVTTPQSSCKVVANYPTYLINHLDVDLNLGGVNGGRGGFTVDFTGCETTSDRETSAGMRIVIPLTTVIGYHHYHKGARFRGNGKNGDSGGTFVESTNAYGNRWYDCWAERGRDAGYLWYSGPTDQHIVDCTADHTNADPGHVTDTANDIYFIRFTSIYCGDDLGNIGYRSGGDAKRPYNIYWENPRVYGQDWGRTLAYGGTHHALATDLYINGGAMANILVGSDGDQANTDHCQVRRGVIVNSRVRVGQKAYYSQGVNAGTIQDGMWMKLLVNKGANTVRQAHLLIEKIKVTDGKFFQIVCYNGGEFDDATLILRGIEMDGQVNPGSSWVDQGTYPNHVDLRGITPRGATAVTTAPTAANGTPPGSAVSTVSGGSTTPTAPADTTAPTVPAGLTTSRTSDTAGGASWTASTDDTAVAGYLVTRTSRATGASVDTTVTTASVSWTNLTAGVAYDVTVRAFDGASPANVSAASSSKLLDVYTAPATQPATGAATPPSTTAARLMYVDAGATAQSADLRITDLREEVTGKLFAWATDAERPIVRTAGGRKVAEFLNGRALLESTGIAGRAALTVTLVMSQRNLVTALRSGYLSACPAGANDFDKTSGQWNIGNPAASGDSAWSSLTVGGAPAAGSNGAGSATFSGFTRALDVLSVVQVALSTDGAAPTVWVDGVQLTTSATNPTTSGLLTLDRLLLGARWYDGAPKDGQQFRLASLLVHEGRLSQADRNAVRSWANSLWSTPAV